MLQDTAAPARQKHEDQAASGDLPGAGWRPAPESVLAALDVVRQQHALRRRLVVTDVLAMTVAWIAVLATAPPGRRLAVAAVAIGLTLAVLAAGRAYRLGSAPATDLQAAVPAVLVGVLGGAGAVAVLDTADISGARLGLGAVAALAAFVGARTVYATWLRASRASGRFPRPVVLIGGNDEAAALEELLRVHPELGFRVLGVVASAEQFAGSLAGSQVPWLGELHDAVAVVRRTGVNEVVIAGTAVPFQDLQRLSRDLPAAGIEVQLSAGVRGIAHRRLRWQLLAHEPVLSLEPPDHPRWQAAVKRGLDVVLASAALVASAPVLIASALAIKLQDGGPVLFAHERVGRDERPFRVFKLRTMVPEAERLLPAVRERNDRDGPLFKLDRDPRVTRVGRFLRQSSIDELPQLINVLRGEMSLVGPRPALASEVGGFDEEFRSRRAAVRPGLTGLWQAEARDNPAFGAYRRLDLFYLENWSIGFDLVILWTTAGRVLGRGLRVLRRRPQLAAGAETGPALLDVTPTGTVES